MTTLSAPKLLGFAVKVNPQKIGLGHVRLLPQETDFFVPKHPIADKYHGADTLQPPDYLPTFDHSVNTQE